jgi:hypothetical protein
MRKNCAGSGRKLLMAMMQPPVMRPMSHGQHVVEKLDKIFLELTVRAVLLVEVREG